MATLVEVAEIREILGVSDAIDDARIEHAIFAVTAQIQAYCGRQFIADAEASARVFVAQSPVLCEVDDIATSEGLVVKTDEDDDGVFETTWAAGDYQTEPLNGRLAGQRWPTTRLRAIQSREWPWDYGQALVQVTARWGWSLVASGHSGHLHDELPHPVCEAAKIQTVSVFKSAEAPLGIAGFGDIGVMRLRQALHPAAIALLEPYRRDPVLVA